MRAFLEEYGIVIFLVTVISILVIMATPLGAKVKTALEGIVEKFSEKAAGQIDGIA